MRGKCKWHPLARTKDVEGGAKPYLIPTIWNPFLRFALRLCKFFHAAIKWGCVVYLDAIAVSSRQISPFFITNSFTTADYVVANFHDHPEVYCPSRFLRYFCEVVPKRHSNRSLRPQWECEIWILIIVLYSLPFVSFIISFRPFVFK